MDLGKRTVQDGVNESLTRIGDCAREIHAALGSGFDQPVYEKAMARALYQAKLSVAEQYPFLIRFDDATVGEFRADFIVTGTILVELKAVPVLRPEHKAQALAYLRASGADACLLINFGRPKVEIARLLPSKQWKTIP
jgi:GxxExxY protein